MFEQRTRLLPEVSVTAILREWFLIACETRRVGDAPPTSPH